MYGDSNGNNGKIKLSDKEIIVNKEILEKLLDRENTRQIELKKLTDKIEVLTNYIESRKIMIDYINMPVSVSERVSTLNTKIENANNCQKDESFSCKARQIIILATYLVYLTTITLLIIIFLLKNK